MRSRLALPLLAALALAGCGRPAAAPEASPPAPRRAAVLDPTAVPPLAGTAEAAQARAEARRRRFLGRPATYAPAPVEPFPAEGR